MTAASQRLLQHPLSAAFPAMSDDEVAALAEDIAKHGQREPGVLFEGMVLDGWHRYRACHSVGVEFQTEQYEGDDPQGFVLSQNLHRRHLTALQKAAAIVAVGNWRKPGRQSNPATVAGLSEAEMAQAAEVSERTIRHAKQAERLGLGQEARDGKVTAKTIEHVATLPKAKRERAVKTIKEGGEPPAPKKPKSDAQELEKAYVRISALETDLEQTKDALAEMTDLAKSVKAFEAKDELKEMQVLRLELRSCKRRRDELMTENSELRKENKRLREKLKK